MKKFWWLLLAVTVTVLVLPVPSEATTARLLSCMDVRFASARGGDNVLPSTCRTEFSAADQFIVLIVDVRDIDRDTGVVIQILDPGGARVSGGATTIRPPIGASWSHYWFIFILPVAATPEQIAAKSQTFQNYLVGEDLTPPIRERIGEWTMTATLSPGATVTHKFTLRPVASP